MDIYKPSSPRDILLSYQDRYAADSARYKAGIFARQTGKDFTSGKEGVSDIYEAELGDRSIDWLIVAPSERQSIESLSKWKQWQEAYKLAVADIVEEREGGSESLLKKKEIIFPNGSRAIAVPGKPDTVRGFSANVLETEAAFFENEAATDAALFPTITNPLAGLKKIRKISTPNGRQGRFFEIINQFRTDGKREGSARQSQGKASRSVIPESVREQINAALQAAEASGHKTKGLDEASAKMDWSVHVVSIYDAVAEGLPVNIAELYAGLKDPEAWAQEYECQFLDTALIYFTYDLMAACESEKATVTQPLEYYQTHSPFPRFWGWDFARSRDKSVFWVAELIGELLMTREVLVMENMPTPAQVELVSPRIAGCLRGAIDYTGPGVGAGDYIAKAFGEWQPQADKFGKVELVSFTNPWKLQAFPGTRMRMEQRQIGLPINRDVRESFHSIHRVVTAHGNISFRAPHTADGHADEATACILADHAARQGGSVDYRMINLG